MEECSMKDVHGDKISIKPSPTGGVVVVFRQTEETFMGEDEYETECEMEFDQKKIRQFLEGLQKFEKTLKADNLARPPLGLLPEKLHNEMRLTEINDAILRFLKSNQPVPLEWLTERDELIRKVYMEGQNE